MAFTTAFISAWVCDTTHQKYLDKGWNIIKNLKETVMVTASVSYAFYLSQENVGNRIHYHKFTLNITFPFHKKQL